MNIPRIIDVKCFDEQIGRFPFGEPDRIRLDFIDFGARLFPKIGRDKSGDIAAETVQIVIANPHL